MILSDLQRVKKLCNWLIFSGFAEKEADIAVLLGYNISSFSQFLNGKKPITSKFLDKICSVDENVNKIYIKSGEGNFFKENQKSETEVNYKELADSRLDTIETLKRENTLLHKETARLEKELSDLRTTVKEGASIRDLESAPVSKSELK